MSTERHEEALERLRSLEGTVERLQAENAALRVEPEWSSGLRSVQEEVSNVDVVRMGKLCRRCLGPMEEFAPGDLLSQAALQMSENLIAELSSVLDDMSSTPALRSERVWIDQLLGVAAFGSILAFIASTCTELLWS